MSALPVRTPIAWLCLIWVVATAFGCDVEPVDPTRTAVITTNAGLPAPRSLNDRVIEPRVDDASYRVLLIGHAYGNFRDSDSDLPASTLRGITGLIDRTRPAFVGLLGDNVRAPEDRHVSNLRAHFGGSIEAPVFAIPGEHDLFAGVDFYRQAFGADYFRIELGSELFLFLNTGGGGGRDADGLSASQLAFIDESLSRAADESTIENVVVLMHNVLWTERPRYQRLSARVNNDRRNPSWATLHQRLRDLARSRRVLVGAGDIGHKSYSFFHDIDPDDGISYFATGLADRASDSVVVLQFPADGPPAITALSLSDQPILESAAKLGGFLSWGAGPRIGPPRRGISSPLPLGPAPGPTVLRKPPRGSGARS